MAVLALLRHGPTLWTAERPAAWFTYHLYYKAPDWLGPELSHALAIPYLVAEASLAGTRAGGPHAAGHEAAIAAVRAASRLFVINPADREGLAPFVDLPSRFVELPAFLDLAGHGPGNDRATQRHRLAERHGLAADVPWLLSVAMMRPGDKLASYEILGRALGLLPDRAWQLLVVGDGPAPRGASAASTAGRAGPSPTTRSCLARAGRRPRARPRLS